MIDTGVGRLIPLTDVPRVVTWLPDRRRGWKRAKDSEGPGKISFATLWRWALKGIGGEKLAVVRVGSTMCTSEVWLMEFFQRCAAADLANSDDGVSQPRTPGKRERANRRADEQLESIGV